jgi:hypothetical protein
LIGNGWGLDHVIVAQRNADEAKQTFGAKLGFSIASGNKFPDQGVENGPVLLPPAYLELVWVYDADKASAAIRSAVDTPLVAMLRLIQEQGTTVLSYNINVSPVEDAASFLRASGFKVTLPPSITTLRDGEQQPGPWQFLNISYEKGTEPPAGVLGGKRVDFLEYRNNADLLTEERVRRSLEVIAKDAPDERRKAGDLHANTARKLAAVWVAVTNLDEAVKQAEALGLAPGRERTLAELGARGREVECGQGRIVFWEAMNDGAQLSALIRSRGLGPFGVSVGVTDLNRAHQIVEEGTRRQLRIQTGGASSFVVPAEAAAGIWLEFAEF